MFHPQSIALLIAGVLAVALVWRSVRKAIKYRLSTRVGHAPRRNRSSDEELTGENHSDDDEIAEEWHEAADEERGNPPINVI